MDESAIAADRSPLVCGLHLLKRLWIVDISCRLLLRLLVPNDVLTRFTSDQEVEIPVVVHV
jgi:hypothetical protein